jgi:hypothetical protein
MFSITGYSDFLMSESTNALNPFQQKFVNKKNCIRKNKSSLDNLKQTTDSQREYFEIYII